jgi:ribosomal-protein-alanine N-acetyltransferase
MNLAHYKRANETRLQRLAMKLRDYTPADFDALYALDRICYPRGIAYSRPDLRWFLAQPGALCVVVESEGALAGFLIADREGAVAHIITIDVAPEQRRRGVGTLMIEEIERRLLALGVTEINLETATDNEAGTAFWRRHGYRAVGVLPGYYLGEHDAFAMQKRPKDQRSRVETC